MTCTKGVEVIASNLFSHGLTAKQSLFFDNVVTKENVMVGIVPLLPPSCVAKRGGPTGCHHFGVTPFYDVKP